MSTQWDSSWPELSNGSEREQLLGYLEDRFGIGKDVFKEYLFFKKRNSWWILKYSNLIMNFSTLKVHMLGIRAFQLVSNYIKPTTRFIQMFGHLAKKAFIEIDHRTLNILFEKGRLEFQMDDITNGYIILMLNRRPIGLGLYINGRIISQLPKGFISLNMDSGKR